MHSKATLLLIIIAYCCNVAFGQSAQTRDSIPSVYILSANPRVFHSLDTTWTYSGICKTLKREVRYANKNTGLLTNTNPKPAFLKIHGNIQYDFLYRSYNDTPFYQHDFRQHTVKTNYSFLFRDLYPVQVSMLHRNSNSPYFRDITDVSVRFSQYEYMRQLKENLLQQVTATVKNFSSIQMADIEKKYKRKLDEVEGLEMWINSPARLQEMVEESERNSQLMGLEKLQQLSSAEKQQLNVTGIKIPELPVLPDKETIKKAITEKLRHQINAGKDSVLAKLAKIEEIRKQQLNDSLQKLRSKANFEEKRKELAKLKKELEKYKKTLADSKKTLSDSLQKIKQEISRLKDAGDIKQYIQKKKMDASRLPKGWAALGALKSVGIGRTWVDYSELTVKNISLSRINVEANPGKLYAAFAAGRINYRFRDFIIKSPGAGNRQSLLLFRGGYGKKDGNNIIFTWYDGKRSLLKSYNDTVSSNLVPERVMGISAETRIKVNEDQFIVAEFAKSSFHNTGTVNQNGNSLFDKVKNFRDHSNEAYSLKLYSHWPKAGIKVTGYYKKMGEHFQSFNLQPVNTIQEAFQLKYQQQLWKKRLIVDAAIRKNDFTNPYLATGISSSNIFKSLQLSLRVPKYPYLTVSYAPSSQLTVLDDRRLAEHQYNTLSALLSHSYRTGKTNMVTNAMFLKFYNNSPDTGFIYYNAASFSLTQVFYTGPLQLQSGLTITDQEQLHVLTLEQSTTMRVRNTVSFTAGMKYNKVRDGKTLWGGNAGMNIEVKRVGTISVNYDKTYLPGIRRDLIPVHTGTIGYYRAF